jgi:hypothetical protein
MSPFPGMPKYGHIKKEEVDGFIFDSHKEAKQYKALKFQKEQGVVTDFQMQVKYELIPKQMEWVTVRDKKGNLVSKEKVAEHACTYIADFVVTYPGGIVEVWDCKGNRALDQKYPIKRKLLRWVHGIILKEI